MGKIIVNNNMKDANKYRHLFIIFFSFIRVTTTEDEIKLQSEILMTPSHTATKNCVINKT